MTLTACWYTRAYSVSMSILQRIRAHALPQKLGGSLGSMELKRVPPDITVAVTHDKAPIANIEVTVVPVNGAGPVFIGLTNQLGHLYIRGLASGRYLLTAAHAGFEAGKESIEVVAAADDSTINHFNFEWNSDFQTRRIAGRLTGLAPGSTGHEWMDIVHPVRAVYGGVAITLRNAFGADEYRTLSNRDGEFLIDNVPEGIYVLTIDGGEQEIGGTAEVTRRLVDVSSSQSREDLPLELREMDFERTEFDLSKK